MDIFTYDEIMYMIGCLNGVRCTPETLAVNLLDGLEYFSLPSIDEEDFIRKVKSLKDFQTIELWNKLNTFWNVEGYSIPNTELRAREVGLIK